MLTCPTGLNHLWIKGGGECFEALILKCNDWKWCRQILNHFRWNQIHIRVSGIVKYHNESSGSLRFKPLRIRWWDGSCDFGSGVWRFYRCQAFRRLKEEPQMAGETSSVLWHVKSYLDFVIQRASSLQSETRNVMQLNTELAVFLLTCFMYNLKYWNFFKSQISKTFLCSHEMVFQMIWYSSILQNGNASFVSKSHDMKSKWKCCVFWKESEL